MAESFDKGLFAGPTPEECRPLFSLGEVLKNREFLRAANAFGHPRIIQGIPVLLKIDADFKIAGNGIDGQLSGMRDVKMERLPLGVLQQWFPEGTRFELDVPG